MGSDRVVLHLAKLLTGIKERCLTYIEVARAGDVPLGRLDNVDVVAKELRQIGLQPAADSLEMRAIDVWNAVLDHSLTENVAAGDDAVALRELFGSFPLPHPDQTVHVQLQSDRQLAILGKIVGLADFVSSLLDSLTQRAGAEAEQHPSNGIDKVTYAIALIHKHKANKSAIAREVGISRTSMVGKKWEPFNVRLEKAKKSGVISG